MSENSSLSNLHTAPIVNDLRGRPARSPAEGSGSGVVDGRARSAVGVREWSSVCASMGPLSLQICELVLADLQLVAGRKLVRFDSPPVDVRAVQGPEVVDVETVATFDQERMVA